jgi:hypothetical protein
LLSALLCPFSSIRFGPTLRYIELPIELITHTVLHELANKCPNLTHMLLDFSTAMQLHDFSEMQVSAYLFVWMLHPPNYSTDFNEVW